MIKSKSVLVALGLTVIAASPVAAKDWCMGIYRAARSGNYAPAGGSMRSAGWQTLGPYSSSSSASQAAQSFPNYLHIGPTTCAKVFAFYKWMSGQGSYVSNAQMVRWNSNYNCQNWGQC